MTDPREHQVVTKKYTLTVLEHEKTGWLVATSEELPELLVQGPDLKTIRTRAPNVIRRILERKNLHIDSVELEPPAPSDPTHFVTREVTVVATFEEAA